MAFADLNKRSLDIFKRLVDAYIETGEPVGSRTISKRLEDSLSPATIRNIMADLEDAGLLYAPHTSAGRLPTDAGLQFFVHGLLEVGDITDLDRATVENTIQHAGRAHTLDQMLEKATTLLSGLSQCAGVVLAPKIESPLQQIEFVSLGRYESNGRHLQKILVVLITQDHGVENRILELEGNLPPSILQEASHYLTSHLSGKTLSHAKALMEKELLHHQEKLDDLTNHLLQSGVAMWAGTADGPKTRSLIIKGQSNLLHNVTMMEDVERMRMLFEALDAKEQFSNLLDASINAEGVQIFVGSECELFKQSGCSLIVAPYKNEKSHIIGAIGVIGPARMNYGKIIPLVDYTAKIIGKIMGEG